MLYQLSYTRASRIIDCSAFDCSIIDCSVNDRSPDRPPWWG
jgi:hypothetical protein